MATGLQVAGLASNFDWKAFIDSVMEVERVPINRLELEKSTNSQRSNLLSTLGSRLTSLQNAVDALGSSDLYGKRSAVSDVSGSTWGMSAASGAAAGTHTFAVTQRATQASLRGAANLAKPLNPDDDVSGLTLANLPLAQAVTAGTFTVNGAKVTVALTDSLQDVFDAIETATGGAVTAAYDSGTDKITLTSGSGTLMLGAGNDTSNFLRALKLANTGGASSTSTAALGSLKTGAVLSAANLATAVTAVDGSGNGTFSINGVAIAYNTGTDTLAAVLKRIGDSEAGVTASFDAAQNRVVLTNKTTGDTGIAVSEAAGGLLGALGLTSGTTFVQGKNAEFTVNGGGQLTSASNVLDEAAHGIAGLTVTAATEDTQTITIRPDTGAVRSKIDTFISAFNDVQQFLEANTRVTTDSKGKVTAAGLAANREVQAWGRTLRNMAFDAVSGLGGTIKRMDDLGIDFSGSSNELTIKNAGKLEAALADATDDVAAFFTTATTGFAARMEIFAGKVVTDGEDQRTRLTQGNTRIDEQIAAIERRLEQQRDLLTTSFIAMENAQSRIKQQQSTIDGMISSFSSKK